ncbi:MAG: hypothetical protein ACLQVI_04155, partial [Polyangiaceae bacterium]
EDLIGPGATETSSDRSSGSPPTESSRQLSETSTPVVTVSVISESSTPTSVSTSTGSELPCGYLETCCVSLPAALQAQCNAVYDGAGEGNCLTQLGVYQSSGYCGGTSTSSGPVGACADLAACCPSLETPAEQTNCDAEVSVGNQAVCRSEIDAYMMEGMCGGTTTTSTATVTSVPLGPCGVLDECCPTLPLADQPSCLEVANGENAENCESSYSALMQAGFCGGVSTGTVTSTIITGTSSSGTFTSTGTEPTGDCLILFDFCCPSAGEEAGQCYAIADSGNQDECAAVLNALESEGVCEGSSSISSVTISSGTVTGTSTGTFSSTSIGDECEALQACCPTLPIGDQAFCLETAQGDPTTCENLLEVYESEQFCGANGSGTGSTGSATAGSGSAACAELAGCCGSLPPDEQESCQSFVNDGNADECASQLDIYISDGECDGGTGGSSGGGSASAGSVGGG